MAKGKKTVRAASVTVAKTAGFCFGVKRAVDQVYQLAENPAGPIYTYGPIIHNEEVVEDLRRRGVEVLPEFGSGEEFPPLTPDTTVVIRSHGVGKKVYRELEKLGVKVVDATCPFVERIHRIVEEQAKDGRQIVVAGNAAHPEVQGICDFAHGDAESENGTESRVVCIETPEEAEKLPFPEGTRVCLVAQTTFNFKKFQVMVEKISEKGYDTVVVNTICNATQERQEEAGRLAEASDLMLVVGGRNSSNTQKLFEICHGKCGRTYFIQTAQDFHAEDLQDGDNVGITAGASTPGKIIEEVKTKMSELSFEQLLEESLKTIHTGEVVTGKVIDVKDDEIILNIGYKSDGIISKNEYSNDSSIDLKEAVKVGDEMEAKILKVNDGEGQVSLSYKRLAADRGNKRLEEAYENAEVLKATVTQVLTGGLTVEVEGSRVFIPASLVSDTYERNLEKYNGQEIEFVITEFNPKKRRIIGNRRQLISAQKAAAKEALFTHIHEGDTVTGTVKNITDFGAFIDLGGADGLLHVSEMSWGRVGKPKNMFSVGQEVTAFIKEINGEKIALSCKFPGEDPWEKAAVKYVPGTIITGRVARMADFGAFVELEDGIDALLHVSQISRARVEKPSDVLKVGQEVTAKVTEFNGDAHRISLSMKALEAAPEPEEAPAKPAPRKERERKEETILPALEQPEANTMADILKAAVESIEE